MSATCPIVQIVWAQQVNIVNWNPPLLTASALVVVAAAVGVEVAVLAAAEAAAEAANAAAEAAEVVDTSPHGSPSNAKS